MADDFRRNILPQLAQHYQREKLSSLKTAHPWLQSPLHFGSVDLEGARDAFFNDGTRCIQALEEYYELIRLEVGNKALTFDFGPIYVIFLTEFARRLSPDHVEDENTLAILDHASYIGDLEDIMKDLAAVNLSWRERNMYKAAEQMCSEDRHDIGIERYLESAEAAWEHVTHRHSFLEDEKYATFTELTRSHSLGEALEIIRKKYSDRVANSKVLATYRSNLQALTYRIGCPQAYNEPERNITALRSFHSTQVPFLAKLQKDLQKEMELNSKQQEIIEALVFRHLLEHLPDPAIYISRNATDNWQAFWDAVVKTEINCRAAPTGDHPLSDLSIDPRIIDPATLNITEASARGQKGQLWRTGKELYGTLSANIHKYKGGGANSFAVRDDHWGEVGRTILNALKPEFFDAEGEVQWVQERNRYR